MSKSFNVNINDFDNNNTMDSIYSGNTPTETPKKPVVRDEKVKDKAKDSKKTNGVNKKDNYTITLKIDADIEDYLQKIEYVSFIESQKSGTIKSTTRTDYINELIRKDLLKLLNLKENADINQITTKWNTYKDENNL